VVTRRTFLRSVLKTIQCYLSSMSSQLPVCAAACLRFDRRHSPKCIPQRRNMYASKVCNARTRSTTLRGHRTVTKKSAFEGALRLRRGVDMLKFDKNSTDLQCFTFQFWRVRSFVSGGLSAAKSPKATGLCGQHAAALIGEELAKATASCIVRTSGFE